MPPALPPLAVPPRLTVFSARQSPTAEQQLAELLRTHNRLTDTLGVTSPAGIMLNDQGLVQGRFRFTTNALSQLCQLLAVGFSHTISDLAGLREGEEETAADPALRAISIAMINQLLTVRFSRVEGMQLILDRNLNLIEGLAGKRYSLYSNWDMYRRTAAFVRRRRAGQARFSQAILYGRKLVLRYQSVDPLLELRPGERFFGGLQFENSEVVTGALRGTSLLLREWCDNVALPMVSYSQRIRHVGGRGLDPRLDALLEQLAMQPAGAEELRSQLQELTRQPLGLGQSPSQHEQRLQELHDWLIRRRGTLLIPGLAKRVLRRMLTFGSYRADAVSAAANPLACYARRTSYDLFNALTRQAQEESLRDRLRCEQLAYAILRGRCKI